MRGIRMPDEWWTIVKRQAKQQGLSASAYICQLIQPHLVKGSAKPLPELRPWGKTKAT